MGPAAYDDIVLGGGHNGLTAAAYLARAGRRVLVLERLAHVGGAAVSERPFAGVDARLSRYAYLVSLLPQQVVADLDLDLRLVRRRFSSYTPLPGDPTRGLLVDAEDPEATRASFVRALGSDADFEAWQRFYARMADVAGRIWPTMLEPLRSAAQMEELAGDDELWAALTRRPLGDAAARDLRRRHRARDRGHRRPHRHLRRPRRPGAGSERLLPLPPGRRWHR